MKIVSFYTSRSINFPVYSIDSLNFHSKDGLLFLDNQIIDDKNMPGPTLGIRRLQTSHTLYKLNRQIDSFIGILKNPKKTFIDSHGEPFLYEKTRMTTLKYYRIHRIEKKKFYSVLWIKGWNSSFIIPRPPPEGMGHVGILLLGNLPWVLYDYADREHKQTVRKV